MRTMSLIANAVTTLTLATLLGGCLDHPIKAVEYGQSENLKKTIKLDVNRDVDILFVVDNSGSMADEQARLARNFTGFVGALEDMQLEYRIGLTTTDVDHAACPTATPEDGDLVLRSCTEAVAAGAFQFNDIDASAACTDQCALLAEQLEIQPSLAADGQRAARPWLESIAGRTNLPEGTTMAQALACFGPQGVDGCGYEAPLEAMRLAIDKGRSEKSQFLRDQALLAVVFVTDEADCSTNPAFSRAFTTEPTFWNDEDPKRTSGICWRAGVECTGEGPEHPECNAVNHGLDGEAAVADEDAVLFPTSRYIDFLDGLREAPKLGGVGPESGPRARDVLVSLIAGVPVGYDAFESEIPYMDAPQGSEQQLNFGVAPGCVNTEDGTNSTAIPPVREREVAEAFAGEGERNLFSICQDDYTDALAQIADAIRRELPPPACTDVCIADSDPTTDTLEPTCEVSEIFKGDTRQIPQCVHDGAGWQTPEGDDVCFYLLTDPDHRTESTLDDMTIPEGMATPPCSDDVSNIEFGLHRSGPRKPDVTYEATCIAAMDKDDCKAD